MLTFMGVRTLTWAIRNNIGPFHNITAGGLHIHHLVWGILLLLVVGYMWLVQYGVKEPTFDWASRLSPIGFGLAAALTLDEFALWLNLKDVYWEDQGKARVEVAAIFLGLLSVWVWGGPLITHVVRETRTVVRDLLDMARGIDRRKELPHPAVVEVAPPALPKL
jgi:hypothetical protein